jgi:hypothetical protein
MSKRKLELIDMLRKTDEAVSECRSAIDNHARGRKYADLAGAAAQLVKHAQAASVCSAELDKLLVEEWGKRRR